VTTAAETQLDEQTVALMINTPPFRRRRAAMRPLLRPNAAALRAEQGFTLIEVMASAMMVGFIAIATFSGFSTIDHTTADQRSHNQAAVLAAQSQEQLRSDSAATLDQLQTSPHSYTQSVNNQTYTITQSDRWVNDNNQTTGCSATSKESNTNQNGSYLRITSAVTWPQLLAANRPAVNQSSIITPPDGSGLEVDVTNGGTPLQAVGGATAIANSTQLTTNESGCVIFGAIPATTVEVEVKKLGDVMENGAYRKVTPELQITPNVTTHYPVTLAPGGAITATFTHEGKTVYNSKTVTGDTFVVGNNNMNELPDYEVGTAAEFEWEKTGEKAGAYRALTGTYATTASTFVNSSYYPTGGLFPFGSAWRAYAGDCPGNEPAKFNAEGASVQVRPGENVSVNVPTSYVNLEAYHGTKTTKEALESTARPVKITNLSCQSSPTPNNSKGTLAIEHAQNTTTAGALTSPFQPYGKFKLCLYDSATGRSYTTEYTNEGSATTQVKLYLKESTGTHEYSPTEIVTIKSASSC
jgi:type II secretory pathway pseudopilin PulG